MLAPICLRVLLALLVDDFEDDAWARDLIAQRLSGEMRAGSLSLSSILSVSVWLPAWQLLCAACERVVQEPYYVPKMLSALFGGLSPAIVYALARHLAQGRGDEDPSRAAWFAWAFAALSPWHAMYSAIGMTESFYGFWTVAAMYALVRSRSDNRWLIVAALALGPATWTRFEGWVLAGAIPAIALAQRRARPGVFVAACVVIAVPPVLWLAINRAVAGDALHFARVGANDVRNFLAFRGPEWSDRGPFAIARHMAYIAAVNGVIVALLAGRGLLRKRTADTKA
ncbi:MAG: glycosyltransferase family 39 protein, partial [Deltaproteobacteria bacterium]